MLNVIREAINMDAIPINYQWSGYSTNADEFKCANFLVVEDNGRHAYICSEINGVALGDYLSKYIIKQPYIRDMESVSSPGYDYWFFKAWEQVSPEYTELDSWVHRIVDFFRACGLITRFTVENTDFFVFSDLTMYESQPLPYECLAQIEELCKEELVVFCEHSYDECGDIEELSYIDAGPWASKIINQFIQAHE